MKTKTVLHPYVMYTSMNDIPTPVPLLHYKNSPEASQRILVKVVLTSYSRLLYEYLTTEVG